MENNIVYNGYLISINETHTAYQYTIMKDGKIITPTGPSFPYPSEAELHAKLYINRLTANKDGWIVS